MRSSHFALLGCTIGLLALAVRFYGIGTVLTVDEPLWIERAQAFVDALERGNPGGTFQGTHPGVVPMLLIGYGMQLHARVATSPADTAAVSLGAAQAPIALATAAGIGFAAVLAALLWGMHAGTAVGVLLAIEPFLVGHSQRAHVDAVLAVLILLAILSAFLAVRNNQRRLSVLAGLFTGLAVLTKLPALFLLLPVGGIFLLSGWPMRHMVRALGLWGGTAIITYVLLWPSMWVPLLPGTNRVALDANLGIISRDVASALEAKHGGDISGWDALFYVRALVARLTPATLLLGIGGLVGLLRRPSWSLRREGIILTLTVIGFLALLTVSAKRADRYALPALAVYTVIGGVALGAVMQRGATGRVVAGAVVGLILFLTLRTHPHALAYVSPLAIHEDLTQSGWGEGLEEAAAVLNAHPLATDLHVATWYPGVLRHFFQGTTMSLSSRDDPRVDYVVTYRNMGGRPSDSDPTAVLKEFADREPAAVVRVLGYEMAWIYAKDSVDRFPKHVGEIVRVGAPERGTGNTPTATEVGQIVTAETDGLSGIRLVFATFSSRRNTGELVVHVRETPDGPDLRTVRIDVSQLEDNAWKEVRFDPLPDSKGKTYVVTLTAPTGVPGNAVTIRYQPKDILPGNLLVHRQALGQSERRTEREGDLAYALLYTPNAQWAP